MSPSPASDETAIRFAGHGRAQCPNLATAGGMQRGRAAGPLAKWVWYYHTHLAIIHIAIIHIEPGTTEISSSQPREDIWFQLIL